MSAAMAGSNFFKRAVWIALASVFVIIVTSACVVGTYFYIDEAYPLPIEVLDKTSVELLDRNDHLLRVYPIEGGRWRMNVAPGDVDQDFIAMLLAYEDKRFYHHWGVDFFAMARAAGQFVTNGRIVSGGSTLTMQLARLIEPRKSRSLKSKIWQMIRAVELENKFSKQQILAYYLKLAPYGGNLEGIRAATLAYFGKEPRKLTLEEAALLVALPQSPEIRRPDRHPQVAKKARNRVVRRLAHAGIISEGELRRVSSLQIPTKRQQLPALAPHLADYAKLKNKTKRVHHTTLDGKMQARLQRVAFRAARLAGAKVSVAIMIADSLNGEILASVGSADYFDRNRRGFIDMSNVVRSPGSTLKPLIYGLAIEEGLVMPETIISDRPVSFSGYRPHNFDNKYRGDVPVREALQLSLNIPAIRLLNKLGPIRLIARMRHAGVQARLPRGKTAGLSIGLGGVGVSLKDLVQIYANFISTRSTPLILGDGIRWQAGYRQTNRMLSPVAAWHINDILAGGVQSGTNLVKIAYKTGTSYGNRDAWSIGYDGRYVIGVWVGRADNVPVPGIMGGTTAAPILFEAFKKSGLTRHAFAPAPSGAVRIAARDLPVSMQRFRDSYSLIASSSNKTAPLRIVFPTEGAKLEVEKIDNANSMPIVFKVLGGTPPFRLLANGKPVERRFRRRQLLWRPVSPGFANMTIIDALGQAKSIKIFLEEIVS